MAPRPFRPANPAHWQSEGGNPYFKTSAPAVRALPTPPARRALGQAIERLRPLTRSSLDADEVGTALSTPPRPAARAVRQAVKPTRAKEREVKAAPPPEEKAPAPSSPKYAGRVIDLD